MAMPSRKRFSGRSPCYGRRDRCAASDCMSPTKWRSRSPICGMYSCQCCRRCMHAGNARSHIGRTAFCGSAAGSAATATATPTSLRIRCVWRWAAHRSRSSRVTWPSCTPWAPSSRYPPILRRLQKRSRSWHSTAATPIRDAADEPYRRAVIGIYARLAATYEKLIGHPPPRNASAPGEPYENAEALRADLVDIALSLREGGAGLLATGGALGRLIRAVETFGFHLATLDLRQNSDVHARVVADLLKVAGVEADYLALDEDGARGAAAAGTCQRTPARQPVRNLRRRNADRTGHRARPRPGHTSSTGRRRSPHTSFPSARACPTCSRSTSC